MITKIAVTADGRKFYIRDEKQDLHTQFGVVSHKEFRKSVVKTNTGKEMKLFKPSFIDIYGKVKRGPQMVPLKDIGLIIAKTGMGSKSIVVDSGSGSGGSALTFANVAKEVHSFEIREDHLSIAEVNKKNLGLKNVTFTNHDITTGIPVENIDILFLDMPNPWLVVRHAEKSLNKGGFIVSYSPTIPQVMDFISEIKKSESFIIIETVELMEREWEIDDRRVRPKSQRIGHSGFLSFARFMG